MSAGPRVVVVTHRGGPLLAACVGALRQQSLPAERLRVVVSARDPVALPPGLEVDHIGENVGFARAANRGLRALLGGPIVLLNDDTVAEPGFLAALAAAVDRPGVYQPRILLQGSDRLDNTGHRLFPDGFNLARGRGCPPGAAATEAPDIGAFSGAAVLFTPEVLAQVGLFDEDLGAFGEDVDLSLRARRQGFPLRYVPGAVIHHALGATYGRAGGRKVYLVERNRVRLALRSLPWTAILTMPLWTTGRLSLMGGAALLGRGLGATAGPTGAAAALAGGLAGLAGTPGALRKRRADRQRWQLGEADMWRHLLQHRVRAADLWGAR